VALKEEESGRRERRFHSDTGKGLRAEVNLEGKKRKKKRGTSTKKKR